MYGDDVRNEGLAELGRVPRVRGNGYATGGGLAQTQAGSTTPVAPGSLSDALQRLAQAVLRNSEIAASVRERLEVGGFLRPPQPQPSEGQANKLAAEPSQLAGHAMQIAAQVELTNAQLHDILRRIDG